MKAEQEFTRLSALKLRTHMTRIRQCLEQMPESSVWGRPNDESNSPANLCLHLAGNLGQLIGHAVGGEADTRRRDEEFSAREGRTSEELLQRLEGAVDRACSVIEGLDEQGLTREVRFRDRDWTVLELVYTCVEHFALHTGQLIYIAKAAGTIRLT